MLDQTQNRRLARWPMVSGPRVRPETIPAIARYLGVSTETLAQLAALDQIRQRQTELRSRPTPWR